MKRVQVCFAGAENVPDRDIAFAAGARNFLFTAYDFIQKGLATTSQLSRASYIVKDTNTTIMDSGLFTMLFGSDRGKVSQEAVESYFFRLVDFIKRMDVKPVCVECDAQKIIGVDKTWELRQKFKDLLPGVRQINVVHPQDDVKGLDRLIEFSDYIGISCVEMRRLYRDSAPEMIVRMVRYIRTRSQDIDIHLLGCTLLDVLEEVGGEVTTADSTSWNRYRKFGWPDDHHPSDSLMTELRQKFTESPLCKSLELTKTPTRMDGTIAMYLAVIETLNNMERHVGHQVKGDPVIPV